MESPERVYYLSPVNQLVLLLVGGVVSALACGISTCVTAVNCDRPGTCTSDGLCSFTNVVSLSAVSAYDPTVTTSSLTEMLRGVCSPGDRLTSLSNTGTCVPYFPFPNAYNAEIEDQSASSYHMRACGAWINAGQASILQADVEYRSMEDHSSWVASLKESENVSTFSPRTAIGQMGKFRTSCMRTALAGSQAIHAAGRLAYKDIKAYIDTHFKDLDGLVKVEGYLTGQRCESAVRAGSTLYNDGSFRFSVTDGYVFSSGALAAALQVVGESVAVQNDAEAAAAAIRMSEWVTGSQDVSKATLTILMEAAARESGLSVPSVNTKLSLLPAVLRHYDSNPYQVKAYEKGIAAFCVYSMMATVDAFPSASNVRAMQEIEKIKSSRPRASALGRLYTNYTEAEVDANVVEAASTVTSSQISLPSKRNANADCLSLMRRFFPEDVDETRFHNTVHPLLYERLESLVESTRNAMALVMTDEPIKSTLKDPQSIADDVLSAGVRIAGAPRGSWGGVARAVPDAGIASDDGMFMMLLKQAHASFRDSVIESAIKMSVTACDHPQFYASETLNAYAIPAMRCTVIFLGMLKRPWADAQYDDESLISRVTAVVGHELAHLSLNTVYTDPAYDTLLKEYSPPSVYSEAIADVSAALAAVGTGMVTYERFIQHWCQLWCARTPFGYSTSQGASHPGPNERCDFLARTLQRHFASS